MIDWGAILAEHGSTVWRTVYRLLNHHADALDCYQETFLTAFQRASRQGVADWAPFLVSVATRRAMDQLRRRYRFRSRVIPIHHVAEPSGEVDCPLQQAQANELMERVRAGMVELPEKQAEVFWLSCLEGLSHQQIADLLQVPLGEVRVLLHRARTCLGNFLSQHPIRERERP
jgi:RNA polymerase sigma-70 factor (ECF subfamily)